MNSLFRVLHFLRTDPRLLAYGFLLSFGSGFGQTYFIALFSGSIRGEYGISHGAFGAVYTVATLSSAAAFVWTGRWIDHIDLRRWTVAVLVLLAGACVAMALAWNTATLIVAIFLLRQMGQGLMSHTSVTSQARYYITARGRAVATAGIGHPVAEAILPPTAIFLAVVIGWRESWLVMAGAIIVVLLPLCLLFLRGHSARHDTHVAATRSDASLEGEHRAVGVRHWTRGQFLRDYRFYVLFPAIMAPAVIATGLFFHQILLVESKGWPVDLWASSFVAFAASSVAAALVYGVIIDRVGAFRTLPFLVAPLGLACVLLTISDHPSTIWGFMVLTGLTVGMSATFFGAFWAEAYGTRHLGAIRSVGAAFMVFSSALSPVAMGVLLDRGVAIESLTLVFAIYCGAASVLALGAARLYTRTITPPSSLRRP